MEEGLRPTGYKLSRGAQRHPLRRGARIHPSHEPQ